MAQSTASIQGTVTDATNNKPISGALVTAVRHGVPPFSQTATSAADGSFQVQSLAAGTYSLCLQVPGDGYLDPCGWAAPAAAATTDGPSHPIAGVIALAVTLTAGQKSTGNTVRIQPGSVLRIRIQDPGQLLNQKNKNGHDHDLTLGVWDSSGFRPVHMTGRDNAGVNYQMTVPKDTPLTFRIQSVTLKIANANSVALSNNTDQQPFQHATGDPSPKSFQYTILAALP